MYYLFILRTDPISVTNNAFSFTATHPVLVQALATLQKTYNPNSWGAIGPSLLTSVARYSY